MNLVELYTEGKSIPEVSISTGLSRSTVRLKLKMAGVLRSRADGVRLAIKKGWKPKGKPKGFKATDETKKKISQAKLLLSETTAKGVSLKPNGYLEVTKGVDKRKGQHRVVMEQHLGRFLLSSELVHHIDENKTNNQITNLKIMSRSEHSRYHAQKRQQARGTDGKFTKG